MSGKRRWFGDGRGATSFVREPVVSGHRVAYGLLTYSSGNEQDVQSSVVRLLDVRTGKRIVSVPAQSSPALAGTDTPGVRSITLTGDGAALAANGSTSSIPFEVSAADAQGVRTLDQTPGIDPTSLAATASGRLYWLCDSTAQTAQLVGTATAG